MLSASNPPSDVQKSDLLCLARRSIEHGIECGLPLTVALDKYHQELRLSGNCFITLRKFDQLRGCMGKLNADRALVYDVADNAFAAAFRDHRFPIVTADELVDLCVGISVLTPQEPIAFSSEHELLEAIEPHVDGLVLEEGNRRSTFLPSVWQELPDKREFLQHLKVKAGLGVDYWSQSLRAFRYHTFCF